MFDPESPHMSNSVVYLKINRNKRVKVYSRNKRVNIYILYIYMYDDVVDTGLNKINANCNH